MGINVVAGLLGSIRMNIRSGIQTTVLRLFKPWWPLRLALATLVASAVFVPVVPGVAGDVGHDPDGIAVVVKAPSQLPAVHAAAVAVAVPARMHGTGAMVDAEGQLHVLCVDPSETDVAGRIQMRERATRSIVRER